MAAEAGELRFWLIVAAATLSGCRSAPEPAPAPQRSPAAVAAEEAHQQHLKVMAEIAAAEQECRREDPARAKLESEAHEKQLSARAPAQTFERAKVEDYVSSVAAKAAKQEPALKGVRIVALKSEAQVPVMFVAGTVHVPLSWLTWIKDEGVLAGKLMAAARVNAQGAHARLLEEVRAQQCIASAQRSRLDGGPSQPLVDEKFHQNVSDAWVAAMPDQVDADTTRELAKKVKLLGYDPASFEIASSATRSSPTARPKLKPIPEAIVDAAYAALQQ